MKYWKQLVAAAVLGCSAQAWATPTLSIDTGSGSTTVGSSVTYAVNINDITDLAGYQFSLTYNPDLFSYDGISEGGFFGGGFDFFVVDDTVPGLLFWVIGLYGDAPASGSGTLANINFTANAVGTNYFGFEDVLFLDSDINEIVVTALPGQTSIIPVAVDPVDPTDPSDVPEPASYMLFGVGLVGAAALRRRAIGMRR